MTEAACASPPDGLNRHAWTTVFFPVEQHGGRANDRLAERARHICADCPVRTECATYALHHRIDDGIWGGLTEANRRTLQRRARSHVA